MSEKNTYEVGISSDAEKQPRRIVFITRKTSAKVKEEPGPQLMSFPHVILREDDRVPNSHHRSGDSGALLGRPPGATGQSAADPQPRQGALVFSGIQELLHYFPPLVAGVLTPHAGGPGAGGHSLL